MRSAVILVRMKTNGPWTLWDDQLRTLRSATEKVGYANARDKAMRRRPSFRVGVVTVLKPNAQGQP